MTELVEIPGVPWFVGTLLFASGGAAVVVGVASAEPAVAVAGAALALASLWYPGGDRE